MHEYEIKSLETGQVLTTIVADGFALNEGGIVTFYKGERDTIMRGGIRPTTLTVKKQIAVTQVSSSTLIIEKPSDKPEVVLLPVGFTPDNTDFINATPGPILHHQI